jgi:predicted DNA-binding WGR domain protein
MTVIRPNLDQAIDTLKLICVDVLSNSNKQWMAWVMPNGNLYVEYGRVGYEPKSHVYLCGSVQAAEAKLSRLMDEKQWKGYRLVPEEEAPKPMDFSALAADERHEIQTRLEELQRRSQRIGQRAQIRFDPNQGMFSTLMAVVTMRTIAQARQALRVVEACLPEESDRVTSRFIEAVEDYLAVMPLKVGMMLNPYQLLGTPERVQSQVLLLDELALELAEVREIRELIRSALGAVGSGSDERARWLQWGVETELVHEVDAEDERARWIKW